MDSEENRTGTGTSPRPEDDLLRRARDGDREAFEALARIYRDRIFWTALGVVNNVEDARDVTQNVLIRLWRVLPRYDERFGFSTWLHRMTTNLAIDRLRREARHRGDASLDERLERVESDPSSPGPLEEAREREVHRIFRELAESLSPQQRTVFIMREIDGITTEEVAETLGLSPSTVRNHIFQARKALRAMLGQRYPEYLPRGGRGGRS